MIISRVLVASPRCLPLASARAVLLAALLAACSTTGTPITVDGVTLLRYGFMNSFPAGITQGTLRIKDGCIWLESQFPPDQRLFISLVLWPSDATFEDVDDELYVAVDGVSVGDGDQVTLGGGEYPDAQRAFVETLVGPLPEQCPSTTYWLASSVRRGFVIVD